MVTKEVANAYKKKTTARDAKQRNMCLILSNQRHAQTLNNDDLSIKTDNYQDKLI
jgi:hypothetical protein